MAGAYKRGADRERGAKGKWTAFWIGADGKKKTAAGSTSKAATEEMARARELEAKQIREGIIDPADRTRREASLKAVEDHAEDYRLSLLAKGDEPKHAAHVKGAIIRLFADASITSIASIRPDQLQSALGRLKVQRSARTCNHALASVKAFATWLYDSERIQEVPRGLKKIRPYPEANDRRVVRRPLTLAELAKLLEATEAGPEIVTQRWSRGGGAKTRMTGVERAWAYRVAMATGFRANEIRSLLPESFQLDGPSPTITVAASASKRGKRSGLDDVQPIARKDAEALREWLATRTGDGPVFPLPEKTALMLAADLARAGIDSRDAKGRVLDFHALRHSFISGLVMSGVNPKVAQSLARHSTIALTLDRYTHLEDGAERAALEGERT